MSDIKDFPTPGFKYRVVKDDRITWISNSAYGTDQKAPNIVKANQQLNGRPISLEKLPTIYAGDILSIPELEEQKRIPDEIKGKGKNEFTFILADREVKITSGSLLRAIDTGADAWEVEFPWTPGKDKTLDQISGPYKYTKTRVYLGGKLQAAGKMYNVAHNYDPDGGRTKALECYSFTADIVDSTVKPPYERNNQTIEQVIRDFTVPKGIKFSVASGVDTGGKFNRVTANNTDTEFGFGAKLASQRGLLLTCDIYGDALIDRANTTGQIVGTIEETQPISETYSVAFDGRSRFSSYRAISQTPKSKKNSASVQDSVVPGDRHLTFQADDSTTGDILKAAQWRKNKILADALTIPFPVSSWYNPNGKLWEPNQLVMVKSKTIGAPDGFTFLIKSVKYNYDAEGGSDAELSLVPPQVYTLDEIQEPWL